MDDEQEEEVFPALISYPEDLKPIFRSSDVQRSGVHADHMREYHFTSGEYRFQ